MTGGEEIAQSVTLGVENSSEALEAVKSGVHHVSTTATETFVCDKCGPTGCYHGHSTYDVNWKGLCLGLVAIIMVGTSFWVGRNWRRSGDEADEKKSSAPVV